MKKFSFTLDIAAPPAAVWPFIFDVQSWPQWTSTMQSVEPVISGKPARHSSTPTLAPLELGSQYKIHQPSLAPATWTVTELDTAGCHFAWTTESLGVTLRATHTLTATPNGCTLTLTLSYKGFLAPVFARVFRRITQEYMETEAHGLKQRSEGPWPPADN